MTPLRRTASWLLGWALVTVVAACSTGGDDTPPPDAFAVERQGMGVTLTPDTCTYAGADTIWATGSVASISLDVVNTNSVEASFEVLRFAEGASFADLEDYLARENERLSHGVEPLGEPSFVSVITQRETPPGERGVLTSELEPGRYAVLCIRGLPLTAVHATAPLVVSPVTLTLTDDSCDYVGPALVPHGPLVIRVDNETDAAAGFELLRIEPPSTFEDLQAHVDRQRILLERGVSASGKPAFLSVVRTAVVASQGRGVLTADLSPGSFAAECAAGQPPTALFAPAAIEVGP